MELNSNDPNGALEKIVFQTIPDTTDFQRKRTMPARVGSSLLTSGNWTALACRGLPAILVNSDCPGTRGAIKTRCLVFSSQAVAVSPPAARQALAWLSRRTAGRRARAPACLRQRSAPPPDARRPLSTSSLL
jgi:hypothetical protein